MSAKKAGFRNVELLVKRDAIISMISSDNQCPAVPSIPKELREYSVPKIRDCTVTFPHLARLGSWQQPVPTALIANVPAFQGRQSKLLQCCSILSQLTGKKRHLQISRPKPHAGPLPDTQLP